MKKLMISALVLLFSISTFAECDKAYKQKSDRRYNSTKIMKKTAVIVGAGAAVAISALVVGPGWAGATMALVGAPGIVVASETLGNEDNTFQKGLETIREAKENKLNQYLADRLDKKISYFSLGDYEQNEIKAHAIKFVNKANRENLFCPHKNGKINVMNYRKMTNYIIDQIKEY